MIGEALASLFAGGKVGAFMKVGFVGLGGMGKPIAANIIRAGFDVTVADLRPEPVEELVALGARRALSASEAAIGADVILASLPTPAASEIVGAEVVANARPGAIYVDLSTILPSTIRKIAELGRARGVDVLDSPVSGGPGQRDEGTLAVMVGGDAAVVERAMPILRAFGGSIFHVGEVGAGVTIKLINNLTLATNSIAVMEAMALGVKAGIKPETIIDVITASSGASKAWGQARAALETSSVPGPAGPRAGFKLLVKDTQLAGDLAKELSVPLLGGAAAMQAYLAGEAWGLDGREIWALIEVFEKLADVRIRPPHL